MRMIRICAAGCCLLLGLSACGSSSYSDQLHSAVGDMANTISTWNGSPQVKLSQTGAACSKAASDLGGAPGALRPKSAPHQYRAEALDLNNAHSLAHAGFKDCAQAAASLDYPLMARAFSEIQAANRWIERARKADR